jgi:hypothetical protein
MAEKQDKETRKYKLVHDYEEQHKYFKDTYTYIPKLMEFLWEEPKIVAKLLTLSNIEDVKKNLAPFIANNFYENILSSVYIEDNLMYIISLLLMEEIKGLEKIEENKFLEETACGYVLEQLKNKTDVQIYFKTIMLSLVEKLETMSSSKKINFNVKQIEEDFLKTKELMDLKYQKMGIKQKVIDRNFFRKSISLGDVQVEFDTYEDEYLNDAIKDTKEKELFNSKYIPDITKDELSNKLKDNEGNKGMKEYLNIQIKNYNKDPKVFSNEKFLTNVYESKVSSEVLALYQIDFFKVVKILDELFNNLMNNTYLLPYSVKCICKIILLLIKKKFPNINTVEQNILISKFFFCKLFLPIFRNPGFGALINNFIISGTTLHNLNIISNVIEKFISGTLIKCEEENGDYSPFNWYFLDKMPEALKFFENVAKVKLPPFIEKLINGNLTNDFKFDYFNENPEEVIFHRSICFSVDDLFVLLSNMDKCKEKLFADKNTDKKVSYLEITLEKINSDINKEILEELKKSEEYEMIKSEKKKKEKQGKKYLNYFLFTDLLVNKKYQKLFSLNQDRPNFTLKELKVTENENDRQKNIVIKVKNFLSSLLYNYRTLVKTDFDNGTTVNTIKILRELKKFMKTSNFVIDGSIPSEWYVNSLLDQLSLLPPDLQSNDYESLYKSMENDVNNSIKEVDFEIMSVCLGKVKFAKRGKIYYEDVKNKIIDIELNEKAQSIIETAIIPSTIYLKYTDKEKEFKIDKGKNSYKEVPLLDVFKDDNEKKKNCATIESFANKFPDISKIQQFQDVDLFTLEEELKFTEELSHFFKIIKDHLTKLLNIDESQKEFEDITNKIYDYVMEKLYDKIYPSEPREEDNLIFKQCILLSWTEPKHFIRGKNNYIFDSFLPDVIGYFDKIEKEKSPRKKLENMSNIFVSIENVVKFNGENKDIGVDDQLPILNYAFIKAHPLNIYTNCKFMNLFLGSKKNKAEDNQLTQLFSICEFVQEITSEKLNDVTEEAFKKNCQIACFSGGD